MANFNMNKVILGGRLTVNPELRQTQSGTMYLSFSIAVNRRFAPKNEDGTRGQAQTDFINCVAWGQQAEFISRYFRKGSSICVVGSIQTRNYVDQQNVKHYVTEVNVEEVNFVDSKSDNIGGFAPTTQPANNGYNPVYGQPQQASQPYMPQSYSSEPQAPAAMPTQASAGQTPAQQTGTAPHFEVLNDDDELPF